MQSKTFFTSVKVGIKEADLVNRIIGKYGKMYLDIKAHNENKEAPDKLSFVAEAYNEVSKTVIENILNLSGLMIWKTKN